MSDLGKEVAAGDRFSDNQILDSARANGVQLSKASLSQHRTDHLKPDVLDAIEAQRQVEAIVQATGQTY